MSSIPIANADRLENQPLSTALEKRVAELQQALRRSEAQQRYTKLRQSVKDVVQLATAAGSVALFVSKGDDEMLNVRGREGWHFPRAVNGKYAGCYPADCAEAVAHLESLRGQGAQYLVFPATAFWWLEYYDEFTKHLQQNYHVAAFQEDVCLIYRLATR